MKASMQFLRCFIPSNSKNGPWSSDYHLSDGFNFYSPFSSRCNKWPRSRTLQVHWYCIMPSDSQTLSNSGANASCESKETLMISLTHVRERSDKTIGIDIPHTGIPARKKSICILQKTLQCLLVDLKRNHLLQTRALVSK